MKNLNYLLAATVITWCAMAQAGPAVGEKPEMAFAAVDGSQISLAKLHGKIVVIDFWATWCGPCMHEAPHMVELNKKYGDKGMQILGISLDRDKSKMIDVAAKNGLTWPMCFDAAGTNYAGKWNVTGIPCTYIISPDGAVLWTGHPAMIDQPLEDAFKNNPPHLVDPAVLTAAKKQMDRVDAAIKTGDTINALQLLASVPAEASKDGEFASRVSAASTSLQSAGAKLVEDVEPLIAAKQYTAASAKLVDLMKALPGSPVADKAQARLADLMKTPEAKAGIEADKRNTAAAADLDIAQKLQAAKKDDLAYAKFKSVAKMYAGTPSGDTASAAAAEYEKDTAFIKRFNESAGSAKAKAALGLAASYVQSGRIDLAKKKYQDVIAQYPGTSFADTAKTELAKLN